MSPPTNGAVSLAYSRSEAAGLLLPPDAVLFPFDGITAEDFLVPDPAPFGADQQSVILPPSSSETSGCDACFHDKALAAVAKPASPEVTTAAVTVSRDAGSLSRAPPSPKLQPMLATGHRTSCYRGVTRYASVRADRAAALMYQ